MTSPLMGLFQVVSLKDSRGAPFAGLIRRLDAPWRSRNVFMTTSTANGCRWITHTGARQHLMDTGKWEPLHQD